MLRSWLIAARPKTLSAAIAPVVVGTALALRERLPVPWLYVLCALLGALCIQVATNFINDAFDFRRGADTGERLGPLRVTQAGLLEAERVLRAGYLCLSIAALLGLALVARAGWPILIAGAASLVMAYAYTGGPFPLAYHGLGDLFVMIFFGLVAVGGTYFVITLRYTVEALLAGLAIGSLSTVILAINNLRDIDGDRSSNKRTLAVRVGVSGARLEIALALAAAYGTVAAIGDRRLLVVLLSLPLAVMLLAGVYRRSGRELNRSLAAAGLLQSLFSLLFLGGSLL